MRILKKRIFTLLPTIFLMIVVLVFNVSAQEDNNPQLPHLFYGTSMVDGKDMPVGTVIIAKVGGEEKGRITTTEVGKYGGLSADQDKLLIQGGIEDEAIIEFYVSTIKANEDASFKSGEIQELNLTWDLPTGVVVGESSGGGGGGNSENLENLGPIAPEVITPAEEPKTAEKETEEITAPALTPAVSTIPAPTGFAALTGNIIATITTPGGAIVAIVGVILVALALYSGYSYLFKKK